MSVRKVVTRKPKGAPDAWPWLDQPAGEREAFCSHRGHRRTDWHRRATDSAPAGKWTCGVCHPPPVDIDEATIERRSSAQQSVAPTC